MKSKNAKRKAPLAKVAKPATKYTLDGGTFQQDFDRIIGDDQIEEYFVERLARNRDRRFATLQMDIDAALQWAQAVGISPPSENSEATLYVARQIKGNAWALDHQRALLESGKGDIRDVVLEALLLGASIATANGLKNAPLVFKHKRTILGAAKGGVKRAGRLKRERNPADVRAYFEREIARHGKRELAIERTAAELDVSKRTVRRDLERY